MGVNVRDEFLGLVECFLYYTVGSVLLTYLGLPIGANLRLERTWKLVIQLLASRLGSWGNNYVSLGGRFILLNSILNVIPIFYMSIMKMHVKVWKKIIRFQKEFLWGRVKRSRSIPWVSWAVVCKPKREGHLLGESCAFGKVVVAIPFRGLWRDILTVQYGVCHLSPHLGGRLSSLCSVCL